MFLIFNFTLAFLPFSFELANFEVGIITLNPYIFGMCLIVLVGSLRWLLGTQQGFVGLHDIFVLLLASTYLISTLLADNIIDSGFLAFHALFVPIVTYFSVRITLLTHDQYLMSLKVFIISVFLFSIYFILEFFTVEARSKVLGIPPIGVATIAVSALMMAFNMKEYRMVRWSGFVILIALFLTFSRAYILTLIFAPLLWILVRRGRSAIIMVLFLASTLLLTVIVVYEPEVFRPTQFDKSVEFSSDRLTNVDFLLGTIYGRALSYRSGIDEFLKSPIFGNGLSSGEYMVTQHNFHIEWLQYGGMFGYLLYAIVIIVHAYRMRRFAQSDNWIAANMVAILLILTNSVTNGLMHGVMPYVLFLLMGLNEARFRINNEASEITLDDCDSRCTDEMAHIEPVRILNFARTKSGNVSSE